MHVAKYRRVTQVDRWHIFNSLHSGNPISEISKDLGLHRSTIYRELKRNSENMVYRPDRANLLAKARFERCRRKNIINSCEDLVVYFLFEGWTPDEISGRMEHEGFDYRVSKQTIYNHLYKKRLDLVPLLKRYNSRGAGRHLQRKILRKGLHIHERDPVVLERKRLGDFERDCMRFSHTKGELLVCTDRMSRYTKISFVKEMKPKLITSVTSKLLKGLKPKTLTNDNGLEFRDSHNMKTPIYFCDPRRPDQRGTIENAIGRLRKYLPLKTDISTVNLKEIENKYNKTPRRCLGHRTPYEVQFNKSVALVC